MSKLAKAAAFAALIALPAQANLLEALVSPETLIKNGTLEDVDPTKRIGPVLENFYDCQPGTQTWESFEGEDGSTIAEYHCTLGQAHRSFLDDEKLIEGLKSGLGANVQGDWDLDGQVYEDAVQDLKKLNLEIQFTLSSDDKNYAFELTYLGVAPTYSDGSSGTVPLYIDAISALYENKGTVFQKSIESSEYGSEAAFELINDVVTARRAALAEQ